MKLSLMEKLTLIILGICTLIFIYGYIENKDWINTAFLLIPAVYVIRHIIIKKRENDMVN